MAGLVVTDLLVRSPHELELPTEVGDVHTVERTDQHIILLRLGIE
jgi:hypothetical protein